MNNLYQKKLALAENPKTRWCCAALARLRFVIFGYASFFCTYCDFANFLRWEKRGACCGFVNFLRSGGKRGLLWFCKLFAFGRKEGFVVILQTFCVQGKEGVFVVAVCKGFVWLFSATPVFFCIYCDFANFLRLGKRGAYCGFANFLRSGRKLGLFCFTKLLEYFNFDLRVFFTRLLIHKYLRFFAEFCFSTLVLALFCSSE